jgi:hypothetical protein
MTLKTSFEGPECWRLEEWQWRQLSEAVGVDEKNTGVYVKHRLIRLDFLGQPPGVGSVHPPYHSSRFHSELTSLIRRAEQGLIPEGQRGYHDIEDCLVNWSDVRRNRWQRGLARARLVYSRMR